MNNKKVILAYSGGLDTSVILKWLINKGYDVVCCIADVGQQEDFSKAKEKALKIGAVKVYVEDLKKEFVEDYIFQALKANAIYEGTYMLGTALARPLIAKAQIEVAKKESTNLVSHGATGKGNDQVRFEQTYMALMHDVEIIAPWKDKEFLSRFKGRSDLIAFAQAEGIPVEATLEKPYSIDDNIWNISYESGELENPKFEPEDKMFKMTVSPNDAPDKETKLTIEFKKGIPVSVSCDGKKVVGSVEIVSYLNELGAKNGIGRSNSVENRITGMKGREVYETPAGSILHKAHFDLEGLVLDREVHHLKILFSSMISKLIFNGFWFGPELKFLMAAIEESQKKLNGKVFMKLYKGNVIITGRESENSLYSESLVSMDKLGDYDQTDAKGFIKVNAVRLRLNALK
jgi:argininosuccinate synthase